MGYSVCVVPYFEWNKLGTQEQQEYLKTLCNNVKNSTPQEQANHASNVRTLDMGPSFFDSGYFQWSDTK